MDDGNKLEIDANLMFEGIISIFFLKNQSKAMSVKSVSD